MVYFTAYNAIGRSVGNHMANEERDVRNVKEVLKNRGYYARTVENGIADRELDTAIKNFQKDNKLKIDGIMRPGGETERALFMPVPPRKPDPGIAVPTYRKRVFVGDRLNEWKSWTRVVHWDHDLSPAEKKAFTDIFAAEGGTKKDQSSTAFAGIMQSTLDGLKRQGRIPEVVKKHGLKIAPKDLDMEDIKHVYRAYFNDVFKGAAYTYSKEKPGSKKSQMLGTIGDTEIASATADVLVRASPGKVTARMVQEAAHAALPADNKISTEGGPGTKTINALRDIASDSQKKRIFLDKLGDLRDKEWPNEKERNDYFRFKKQK